MSLIATLFLLAQPADPAALPVCDTLEADVPHADCQIPLTSFGEGVARVAFAFSPSETGEAVAVTLHDAAGAPLAGYRFETESFFYPRIADIDADGVEDLLVPLMTGNVNTDYALLMGGEYGFSAPLSVSGHTVAPVEPGLFVVHARVNAAAHVAEFYVWNGATLVTDAIVSIEMSEIGADCRLVSGGEFRGEDFYCNTVLTSG